MIDRIDFVVRTILSFVMYTCALIQALLLIPMSILISFRPPVGMPWWGVFAPFMGAFLTTALLALILGWRACRPRKKEAKSRSDAK